MSYCQIIEFVNGKAQGGQEFSNSWGGSACIWTCLYDEYLRNPDISYDCWLSESGSKRLWDLVNDDRLSDFEKSCLAFTYDYFIVEKKNFKRFCNDLRKFNQKYRFENNGKVCHLINWLIYIEHLPPEVEAIGLYGTSVGENTWFEWDEDKEESEPYNLATGEKHVELYSWLKEKNDG